ncbi:hypothetical protein OsI_17119 [Oryza sativa Indica Group]|uniref:Uncharacterized protein n=1 Tax=Oryza sativa subsp. indica TaxID=39946 RepID=B8ATC3_ORYSI|nr:hypothetical protein OsI_17119 [Oryza sativa Indica Group]
MGHRKRSKVDISSESNSDNDCSLSSDNHDGDVHLSNHDESSDNHDQHFEENDPLLHLTKEELMKKLKIKLGKRPFTDDHKKKNDLMKHPSKTNFGMVQKSFSGASLARPIEICDMMRVLFSLTPYLKKKKTINTMLDADCLDCGIFTLKFMEIWRPRVLLTNQFSQKDIPNIRVQYVNKLFFHPCNIVLNSATKKLVTDYYAKG